MPLQAKNRTVSRGLANLERHQLIDRVVGEGWSQTHALELFKLIQRHGYRKVEELPANRFPKKMMYWLKEQVLWTHVQWKSKVSEDGSAKYVSQLYDDRSIETLFMPMESRDTICLSSQAGCAMGCTFCATGTMGLHRNLTPEEMLHQVRMVIADQGIPAGRQRRLNLHFMGMGEPLHNFEHLMSAFRMLTDPQGLGFPERDIGVSTCGYLPGMLKLAKEPHRPFLMISLGSTVTEQRSLMMPVNRSWPLDKVLEFLREYPLKKREKIMLTYVLIKNQNDSLEDANRLVLISRMFPCMINLIPMNEHDASPDMREPDEDRIQQFYRFLVEKRTFCTIRRSRGRDILGACGQFFQSSDL